MKLNEISPARLWKHINNPDEVVIFVSADRGDSPLNRINYSRLKTMMTSYQLGYFRVKGTYLENPGTPEEREVEENSIGVFVPEEDEDRALAFALMLAIRYQQDSIMYVKHGKAYFIYTNKMNSLSSFEVGRPLFQQLREKNLIEYVGRFRTDYLASFPYGSKMKNFRFQFRDVSVSEEDNSWKTLKGFNWEILSYNKQKILNDLREDLFRRDLGVL